MACPSELENYFKLQQLLSHANKIVMKVFTNAWKRHYLLEWEENQPSLNLLDFEKTITMAQYSQRELIKNGNAIDWDITLFYVIFLTPPFNTNWYCNYIKQIKDVRNKVSYAFLFLKYGK